MRFANTARPITKALYVALTLTSGPAAGGRDSQRVVRTAQTQRACRPAACRPAAVGRDSAPIRNIVSTLAAQRTGRQQPTAAACVRSLSLPTPNGGSATRLPRGCRRRPASASYVPLTLNGAAGRPSAGRPQSGATAPDTMPSIGKRELSGPAGRSRRDNPL